MVLKSAEQTTVNAADLTNIDHFVARIEDVYPPLITEVDRLRSHILGRHAEQTAFIALATFPPKRISDFPEEPIVSYQHRSPQPGGSCTNAPCLRCESTTFQCRWWASLRSAHP